QALVESIYVHMAGGTTVHAQRESLFAGNGIGMVLPLTPANALVDVSGKTMPMPLPANRLSRCACTVVPPAMCT
ncbi:hypothetical protein QCD79_31960, partial [Pseudomonas quasicaspiana]|nr:hypothetical protein [Pseudomonas quasicaspiana]